MFHKICTSNYIYGAFHTANYFQMPYWYCKIKYGKGKGKGKINPRTGHEGPEGEEIYTSTLSLTLAPDGVGGQRYAPAVLPLGKTRYSLFRGGWVGPTAGLDCCETSRPQEDSIPEPCRYNDWVIPAQIKYGWRGLPSCSPCLRISSAIRGIPKRTRELVTPLVSSLKTLMWLLIEMWNIYSHIMCLSLHTV